MVIKKTQMLKGGVDNNLKKNEQIIEVCMDRALRKVQNERLYFLFKRLEW